MRGLAPERDAGTMVNPSADPEAAAAVLYRSETLEVRAALGRSVGVCFVVFDPMVETPSLAREAFGEAFFATYRLDAVHILSARNNWYQDEALPEALAAVRALTGGYARVITYGSSMGGYAALRFSAAVGAQAAIAISPQYSMQPAAVPFETRWSRERDRTRWLHERPGKPLPPVAEAIVFADACGPDGRHAAAIRRDLPHARIVPMRHAGHPAGTMLAEVGLLASTVLGIATSMPDTAPLLDAIRRRRHRSGQYLFTLARRQPLARLRLKARLARRATETGSPDPFYLSYAGLTCECLGETRQALAFHRAATRRPGSGQGEVRLAHALCRAGALAEAAEAAERARALLPLLNEPAAFCALMRAVHGAPGDALLALTTAPRYARRPDRVRLLTWLGHSPLMRTPLARGLGRWIARWRLARTVLRADHPLRQLVLTDRST